ncbi:MAG: CopG family transcriptional regulator, partial [Novosphingobium sp.]|nr:CopG family transcriptional regulator [Novosphingobium sp.]
MPRILADIPDEDIKWLDELAAEQGKSRAAVLREAVSAYKAKAPGKGNRDWIERGYG